jgi:FKBP-type peptidyl-prolyl cis-trans isomerase FkpA
MNLQKTIFLASMAFAILLQSCSEYKTTDGGVKYKIIKDSAGPTVELGGAVFGYLYYKNEKDTFNSTDMYGRRSPVGIKLDTISTKGGFEEIFPLLSIGDSASFIIRNDTLYKNVFGMDSIPKELKAENTTTFFIKVVRVLSRDSVNLMEKKRKDEQLAAEARYQMQIQADTLAILEYFKKNHINAKRTPLGVYYVVKKSAEGITLQPGETAMTFYAGSLLDGTKFESNFGKDPFPVEVGMGRVIRGWDSGLMALKKGEKATLYIPSHLAYGDRPQGPIPPNSILVFDIEILK